jgi:hypothetical protein
MGLLCKRYDMIALLLQAAPKVHHNLPKAIITLNSPEAIITGDLLCGRLANVGAFFVGACVLKSNPPRKARWDSKHCAPVLQGKTPNYTL